MKKLSLFCIALVLMASPAFARVEHPPQTATEPAQIADLDKLSKAVEAVGDSVSKCVVAQKGAPESCQCEQKDDRAKLNALIAETLKKNPKWKDAAVSYKVQEEKENPTRWINFRALRLNSESIKCE